MTRSNRQVTVERRGSVEGPRVTIGTLRITERAKALVLEALEHNRLSYGPMTRRAEAEFLEALQPHSRRLLEREADGCRYLVPEIRPPLPSDMAVPR